MHQDATILASTTVKPESDEMLLNSRSKTMTVQKRVLQGLETSVLSESGEQNQDDHIRLAPQAKVNDQKLSVEEVPRKNTLKLSSNYTTQLKKSLMEAYSDVRHQLQTSHQRQRGAYNKKVHGKPYKEGDFVWLYNTTPGTSFTGDISLRTNSGRIPTEGEVM